MLKKWGHSHINAQRVSLGFEKKIFEPFSRLLTANQRLKIPIFTGVRGSIDGKGISFFQLDFTYYVY